MKTKKKILKAGSLLFGSIGVLLLMVVLFPLINYKNNPGTRSVFLSPIPDGDEVDLSKASTWFPTSTTKDAFNNSISYYNLSIPKLGINEAVVSVGGEDLADSLIQYPGTALPGKVGNTVVFGHSALPAFYNPKEYLTIFSTLPTLKKGDLISVIYDGITYEYKVSDLYEVFPTDLEVLKQNDVSKTLSLVTCVPPGDPRSPRRLVVKATLVQNDNNINYGNNRV